MCLVNLVKYNQECFLSIFGVFVAKWGKAFGEGFSENCFEIFPREKFIKFNIFDEILEKIPEYDHIFIVRPKALGEAYMFCYFYRALVKKYNAKNPCVVVSNFAQQSLLKVFGIDAEFIEFDINKKNQALKQRLYSYKRHIFHIYPNTLKESMRLFSEFEEGMTYPVALKKTLDLEKFDECDFKFDIQIKSSVGRKMQSMGLDIENLVVLVPEAFTIGSLPHSFWLSLAGELQYMGYSVVFSLANNENLSIFTPNIFFDIEEVLYLASVSKGIVTLRSGLCEPMTRFDSVMHVIYTSHRFNNVSSSRMLDFSRLTTYPMVNNKDIFEYDKSVLDYETLKNKIIEDFKSRMENEV